MKYAFTFHNLDDGRLRITAPDEDKTMAFVDKLKNDGFAAELKIVEGNLVIEVLGELQEIYESIAMVEGGEAL